MRLSPVTKWLSLALLATSVVAPAYADDTEMYAAFMAKTEGKWSGSGSSRDYTTGQSQSFNVSVDMYGQGPMTWAQVLQKQSQSGGGGTTFNTFRIVAQTLMIDMQEVFGGVAFVEFATGNEIQFRVQQSDFGNFIDWNYRFRVSGDTMEMLLRVDKNGMPIYEEGWRANRNN